MKTKPTKILWNEQNKIRIRESDITQQKHLIVKALIMLHLKIKHRKYSKWIKLYSEFPVVEGKICDVYYENIRTKEAFAYEVQRKVTTQYEEEVREAYKDWEVYGMKTADYVVIGLNNLSNNIHELSEQIKELIF